MFVDKEWGWIVQHSDGRGMQIDLPACRWAAKSEELCSGLARGE